MAIESLSIALGFGCVRVFMGEQVVLQVGLFGSFRVKVDGVAIHCELGRSGRNMASFLFAFAGRPHRRERLADIFWPGLDPERSRAALNSAIWRLRKMIEHEPASHRQANVHTVGSQVILEHAAWIDIDTHSFEKSVRQCLASPIPDAPIRKALRGALDRYDGAFLDGEDADWILEERERLHSLFVRAAFHLMRSYGLAGSYEEAIQWARRILSFDPYRESAMRALLVLLSLNDQRAEALRTYARWSETLKRELDVEPMPATVQLLDRLRGCRSSEEFETVRDEAFPNPRATEDPIHDQTYSGHADS
jgi:DNA-binding SARP family transcriptional activator